MSEPTDQAAVRPLPRKRAVRGATEAARLAADHRLPIERKAEA